MKKLIYQWEQIRIVDSKSPYPLMVLADLNYRAGNLEEAKKLIEEVLDMQRSKEPKEIEERKFRSDCEFLYGTVLLAQGNAREGLKRWVAAMRYNPNFALESGIYFPCNLARTPPICQGQRQD